MKFTAGLLVGAGMTILGIAYIVGSTTNMMILEEQRRMEEMQREFLFSNGMRFVVPV